MKKETIIVCFCVIFAAVILAETGVMLSDAIYQHSQVLSWGLNMVRRERERKDVEN